MLFIKKRLFCQALRSQERLTRCIGANGIGYISTTFKNEEFLHDQFLKDAFTEATLLVKPLLYQIMLQEQGSALFCLSALPKVNGEPTHPDLLDRLVWLWRKSSNNIIQNLAARALVNQPIATRLQVRCCGSLLPEEIESIFHKYDELEDRDEKTATLVVAWYLKALSDNDLRKFAHTLLEKKNIFLSDNAEKTLKSLLDQLGESFLKTHKKPINTKDK